MLHNNSINYHNNESVNCSFHLCLDRLIRIAIYNIDSAIKNQIAYCFDTL